MTRQESDAVEAIADIVVTGAAAAAAGGAPKDVAAAVIPVAVARLIPALREVFVGAHQRKVALWLTEIAMAMSLGSVDDLDQLLEGLTDDRRRRGLLESYHHLLNMLDENVMPMLAKLTALYIEAARAPDAFFRSAGGLLAELEREDCECLTSLFIQLEPYADESWIGVQLHLFTREDRHLVEISAWHPNVEEPEKIETELWDSRERVLRVFGLLKRFDLARDTASGTWASMAGPDVARFVPRTVRCLLPLFTTRLPPGTELLGAPKDR